MIYITTNIISGRFLGKEFFSTKINNTINGSVHCMTYLMSNGKRAPQKQINEIIKLFDKNLIEIKNLVNKIADLSKITLEQRNSFLYDESNYVKHTFYSEFN